MSIDERLRELIVCPADHGELVDVETDAAGGGLELVCQSCGLAYPVRDDIPVLLVDEARATRSSDPSES